MTTEPKWYKCELCRRWRRGMSYGRCKECTAEIASFQQSHELYRHAPRFTIVSDPSDPLEAFRPGAGFSTKDHRENIKMQVYTPGTIIRDVKRDERIMI